MGRGSASKRKGLQSRVRHELAAEGRGGQNRSRGSGWYGPGTVGAEERVNVRLGAVACAGPAERGKRKVLRVVDVGWRSRCWRCVGQWHVFWRVVCCEGPVESFGRRYWPTLWDGLESAARHDLADCFPQLGVVVEGGVPVLKAISLMLCLA